MIHLSIRARLTAWYVVVLAVATITLTAASWWFSTQSVVRAADVSLLARVQGVQAFLDNPRTRLTVEGLQDEFSEYAELTRGEALLEVVDPSGAVLTRPAVPGWTDLSAAEVPAASRATSVVAADRTLGRLPFRVASARVAAAGGAYRVIVAAPMGPAYAALNRFHRLLLLLLPAVLVVAGAGGYWISHRALAPVDRVTRAVQAITVQRLDQRVEVPAAHDEIHRLASTFNDVLSRLQSAVSDIVRFTADASHELRTPVALVRTTAELALRRDRTPEEYRAAMAEVLDHTTRMSALVDDLLALARADAGIEVRREDPFDLRTVVRSACREAAALAAPRNVLVDVSVPDQPVWLRGESAACQRVLMILLDNAVRYSPANGRVGVAMSFDLAAEFPTVVTTVADNGIGIDPIDVPRLFERFYRGARARQQSPEGNGLGLAIAQGTAERYGWVLSVGSTVDGGGCRVELRTPLDSQAASESTPALHAASA